MHYIGIDLGGTRIKIGLMHDGGLKDLLVLPAQSPQGLAAHLQPIDDAIAVLKARYRVNQLGGVAMAFPGLVDVASKRIISTNKKYDDAPGLNLEEHYGKRWEAPFFIDNDARTAAVGEWQYGAGKGYNNLVMVTLGTGVGTSAVIEGKLLRGKHYQAGCLGGHFVVNYKGQRCTCGNTGCVEAEAATWNLGAKAAAHPQYTDSSLSKKETMDFEAVFAAAAGGDAAALAVKEDCLGIWSAGIISYIHAYDPEVVVVGGGVIKSAEAILPFIQQQVAERAWTPWGTVQVKAAVYPDDAGIRGAVHCLVHGI